MSSVPLKPGEIWVPLTLTDWLNQSAPTDSRGPRVRAGVFMGRPGFALRAFSDDVAPRTPNTNPRAQLTSPPLMLANYTYRISQGMWIPRAAMPRLKAPHWVEMIQWAYGPPYAGSPALRIMTQDGVTFGQRRGDGPYAWKSTLFTDCWWNFELGVKLSRSATGKNAGYHWLAAYPDGKPYTVVIPPTKVSAPPEQTITDSMKEGPLSYRLNAYMDLGAAPEIGEFYFSRPRIECVSGPTS